MIKISCESFSVKCGVSECNSLAKNGESYTMGVRLLYADTLYWKNLKNGSQNWKNARTFRT